MTPGVYLLIDPRDGVVKYVGQSIHAEARAREHMISPRHPVVPWVLELRSIGERPFFDVIPEPDPVKRDALEQQLIWENEGTVLNILSGGRRGFTVIKPYAFHSGGRQPPIVTEETFIKNAEDAMSRARWPEADRPRKLAELLSSWRNR